MYEIGIGYGLGAADIDPIDPQPKSVGIEPTRRTYAADATVYEEKQYAELVWTVIGGGETYYNLLVQFGLESALTSKVTIRLLDNFFRYTLFQGVAIRPEHGKEIDRSFFPRNIKMVIRDLEQLVEV